MALKTIQAECSAAHAELAQTIGVFLTEARKINAKLQTFEKSWQQMEEANVQLHIHVNQLSDEVHALNGHGIVQLDEMKKLLILASQNGEPHPVKMEEIQGLEKSCRQQIQASTEAKVLALLDKQTAPWPDKLAVGMVFKDTKGGRLIEIVSVGTGATAHKVKRADSFSTHEISNATVPTQDLVPTAWHYIKK